MRKISKTRRPVVSDRHVFQLLVGHDFFGTAYGDVSDLTPEQWTAAFELMRRHWADPTVRARVYALSLARDRPGPPWAAVQFDGGPEPARRLCIRDDAAHPE